MRQMSRPEVARAKAEEASGGDEDSKGLIDLVRMPSKEHQYAFDMNETVRTDTHSMRGELNPKILVDKFEQHSARYLSDPSFPHSLPAISSVGRILNKILDPISKKEREKIAELRKSGTRKWEDVSDLKPEEGALLSAEDRQKIKEVNESVRAKGWESYSEEAKKAGILDATRMPQAIDYLFLAYLRAVRDFYPGTKAEVRERLDECNRKILAEDVPRNNGFRMELVQTQGDATKMFLDLFTGKGEGTSPERLKLWLKAGRKLGGSL